ncbi:hypothetical protein MGYG_06281 [Nannizzia gypsea CBS 118893]|uniref:2-oxoadipate dioxygenase/decarboxylase n=1 Tax=Arthroderma gypseum (strain ATCC MYA-4604 / CBS 118893) TaxID=535722 RepID=E4UYU9_ARTGP|nr:hypothetical protein MGYG_06281 [Nannizzia gypsea CBS 118893]EFR03279.1 hypothetical protein MGYG_06281 [Nannizzia gypsea CBS 118893]
MAATFCDRDALRTRFSKAMSDMYKNEVPSYADLIDIVTEVNANSISQNPLNARLGISSPDINNIDRLTLERHGAIRLGTPFELSTIRRLFSQFGMYPVGYYDLSVAGLPLHATAFRPIDAEALEKNPFRVFTTLLRPDLLRNEARELSQDILRKRKIFPNRLLDMLDDAERKGGVVPELVDEFIKETLEVFCWHETAATSHDEYLQLKDEHPLLADIASFQSAHINHLTPRTLDIDQAQVAMKLYGLQVKERVEGPPPRKNGILLRQTSFKAIHEKVRFCSSKNGTVQGIHTARFGEIEQRGAALTYKGRELYDALLMEVNTKTRDLALGAPSYNQILAEVFSAFPDDKDTLRSQELIFCCYKPTTKALALISDNKTVFPTSIDELLGQGYMDFEPVTYEDFLPFSAAGIFRSNLGEAGRENPSMKPVQDKMGFEECLGDKTLDSMELYSEIQRKSLEYCLDVFNLKDMTR